MTCASLIDAWDGRLWEQEQPLAVLLSECSVPTDPDLYFTPECFVHCAEPCPVVDEATCPAPEQHDGPGPGAAKPGPIVAVVETASNDGGDGGAAPEGPPTGVVRKTPSRKRRRTSVSTSSIPSWSVSLQQAEKAARKQEEEEEQAYRRCMIRHKRDDREFWQLLERQRLRRRREFEHDYLRHLTPLTVTEEGSNALLH